MSIVVLATDPQDGNARAWCAELAAVGETVSLLTRDAVELPDAELVVPYLLRTGDRPLHPSWDVARRFEQAGVPLTNATGALARCADKWRTHAAWARAGLPQPRTWRLDDHAGWAGTRVLVKPAFGESARGIRLVADRAQAARACRGWERSALVQEVIPCRSVLRVHATPSRVVGAHARPAAAIAGLPEPDPVERAVPVSLELELLATTAVRVLGAVLVGLDVIEHDGGLLLLEANPPFSLPTHLPEYLREITLAALACRRTRALR